MKRAEILILVALIAVFLIGCQNEDSSNHPKTTVKAFLVNSPYYPDLVWPTIGGKGDIISITAALPDQNIPIIYNTKTHELKAVPQKMNGFISPHGQWLAGVPDDANHQYIAVNLNDFSVISCLNIEDYYDVKGLSGYNEMLWSEDSNQLYIIVDERTQCDLWQYDLNLKQARLISRKSDDFLRAASNDDWVLVNYPGGKSVGQGQSSLFRYNPQTKQKVVLAKTQDADQKVEVTDYKNGYILATRGPINEVEASEMLLFTPQNETNFLGKGHFPLFRKDTDEVCYISEDLKFLVSYNFKTSEEHTLLAFPKPLRAAHCYYWIDTNSVVVYDPQLLILEIDSKYRI